MTFLLSDSFPDLKLTASFMPSVMSNGPPHLMIEAAMGNTEQALCVQSIRCPDPVTTTTTMTITTPTTSPIPITASNNLKTTQFAPGANQLAVAATHEGSARSPNFWEAIMASSNPRSWVISTIVLAVLCLVLLFSLFGTCLWLCRVKRHYYKKQCRGVCRFGCKCSAEAIRQAAADAAVYGPVDIHQAAGGGGMGNGSLMTYPSVGRSWGLSNGNLKQPFNPLYVSLAANDKLSATQCSGSSPSQVSFAYSNYALINLHAFSHSSMENKC